MDVEIAGDFRRDADLIAFGHGRCHRLMVQHRPSRNKPQNQIVGAADPGSEEVS